MTPFCSKPRRDFFSPLSMNLLPTLLADVPRLSGKANTDSGGDRKRVEMGKNPYSWGRMERLCLCIILVGSSFTAVNPAVKSRVLSCSKGWKKTSQETVPEKYISSTTAMDFTKIHNREIREMRVAAMRDGAKLIRSRPYNCSNLLMLCTGFLSR